MTYPLIWRCC